MGGSASRDVFGANHPDLPRFWRADLADSWNQLNHILKNIAILGGMLVVFAIETSRGREPK